MYSHAITILNIITILIACVLGFRPQAVFNVFIMCVCVVLVCGSETFIKFDAQVYNMRD